MAVILEHSTFAGCPSAERAPSHPGSALVGWDGMAGPSVTAQQGWQSHLCPCGAEGQPCSPLQLAHGDGRERERALDMNEKFILEQPLPRAHSCRSWMGRLAVAGVTPCHLSPHASVRCTRHTPSYHHPKCSLGSDIPHPSGSCYSLPSQLTATPGGEILSHAFIPISVHPPVCPELPKLCLLLFSCLEPFRCAPCCFCHPKEGIWGVCYLGGGYYRGMCPCLWHNRPSKLKLTPGQV